MIRRHLALFLTASVLLAACSDDAVGPARQVMTDVGGDGVASDVDATPVDTAASDTVTPPDTIMSPDTIAPPDTTAPDVPPPPLPAIRINELDCSGDEWVELFNPSEDAFDLVGWVLTDDVADALSWFILPEGSVILPGGFMLVRGAAAGGFSFGLSCDGDSLVLLDPGLQTRDITSYGPLGEGVTWGRLPDGEGVFSQMIATPGEPNQGFVLSSITVNEVECRGDEEWIELANHGDEALSLAGWRLTDDPDDFDDPLGFVLPDDASALPGGHHLVRAQSRDADGFLFSIGCNGDRFALWRPDGVRADLVTLGDPAYGGAWGRLPDATGDFAETTPTPDAANEPFVDVNADLFDPLAVHTLDFTADPADLARLALFPREYIPATLTFTSDADEALPPMTVGLRLKGRLGSFRTLDQKAGFKVKINWDDPDQRLLGQKKLTVNNMVQDRSKIHEWTAYAIFREMGLPAPRVGYLWVTVNGEDYGLYANIEGIDDVSLPRFFDTTGHLYEGAYGQDLRVSNLWEFDMDEGDANRRDDLWDLITRYQAHPPGQVFNTLDDIVDWDITTGVWAVELFIGHWDGYAPTQNNYYMHFDDAGVAAWLPWGVDQTFSSHLDFYDGRGFLFESCLQDVDCLALYNQKLLQILTALDTLQPIPQLQAISDHLDPYFLADPRTPHSNTQRLNTVQSTIDYLLQRRQTLETLTACLSQPNPDPDGDGFLCNQDCLPDDPLSYPGAPEICGDGVDQDCNGWADDGPTCPDCFERWRGPHRYLICTNPRSFDEALLECQAQGASLVVLNTLEENLWLYAEATAARDQNYWIGLEDRAVEGDFVWVDGSPLTFTNWNGGEPNNAGNEDCAHFWGFTDRWNDIPCNATMGAVCEDLCPPGPDTDADGDGALRCGDDCDDGDPLAYPTAPEICGDGIDQDCDGTPDNGCP